MVDFFSVDFIIVLFIETVTDRAAKALDFMTSCMQYKETSSKDIVNLLRENNYLEDN